MNSGLKRVVSIVSALRTMRSRQVLLLTAALASGAVCLSGCGDNSVNNGASSYTLQISTNPIGGGTVSRNPDKSTYSAGEQVTVKATAASGYKFVVWSGVSTSTSTSVTVTMNANLVLTANFQPQSFIDSRNGKTYTYVTIGNQTWMAENLNYQTGSSWCYNMSDCSQYGRLYDWYTARTACPVGWHLPSNTEWEILIAAVGGNSVAGKKLKTKTGWAGNVNGTDNYGFAALPGGFLGEETFVGSGVLPIFGVWWTSSAFSIDEAYSWWMSAIDINGASDAITVMEVDKSNGLSVRCVQ